MDKNNPLLPPGYTFAEEDLSSKLPEGYTFADESSLLPEGYTFAEEQPTEQQAIERPIPKTTYEPTTTRAIARPQVGTTPRMENPNVLSPQVPIEEAPDRSGIGG